MQGSAIGYDGSLRSLMKHFRVEGTVSQPVNSSVQEECSRYRYRDLRVGLGIRRNTESGVVTYGTRIENISGQPVAVERLDSVSLELPVSEVLVFDSEWRLEFEPLDHPLEFYNGSGRSPNAMHPVDIFRVKTIEKVPQED